MTSRSNKQTLSSDRRTFLRRAGSFGAVCLAGPIMTGCEILGARDDTRYTVSMTGDYQFTPAGLSVPLGSTVVWHNQSTRRHAVTTDREGVGEDAQIALPEGVLPFNSPDLFTGETWRVHFTVPGAYVYACPYHHDRGMIGSIIVEE
jgi:plastocyanin